MKWIDQQDDYFLSERSSGSSSDTSKNPVPDSGEQSAPSAADEQQPASAPKSNEFSFTGTSESGTSASDKNNPESMRRKRRRRRVRLFWFFLILFAIAGTAFYIRYFVPYTSDTLTSGYIVLVEKRGLFFKTYEGEMISESMLADTAKVYSRDFYFSIPNDSLARVVQSYQGTGRRVTLTTQKYYGILPWRGSQKSIVTAVTPDPVTPGY